ncbi:hypothetical protein OR16_36335 [Cupriavidus basilensis OR16]|uniref:Uncharacterized protein n=1 Tax=Cupriavidus basilensis OR16 TaxID=1127483 RepID=H1SFX5_9BURK|nr:hypothetical protein OR16_36335 [Cupriavidus basilensis OR16]
MGWGVCSQAWQAYIGSRSAPLCYSGQIFASVIGEANLATVVCRSFQLHELPMHEAFEVGRVQFEIPVCTVE